MSKMLSRNKAQGKVVLLMSKGLLHNKAHSRKWSAPPLTKHEKSTEHNDQDPWWEQSSSYLRGKDLKENLVHPLRRCLYRSACFVFHTYQISRSPEFFMGIRAGGNMKSSCTQILKIKTNYNVSFRYVRKDKVWTCTDMVDVHNITDWHAGWRAQHHRRVDMPKQVHISNGKHIEHRDVLYVLQK